jgi:hypothetical protein
MMAGSTSGVMKLSTYGRWRYSTTITRVLADRQGAMPVRLVDGHASWFTLDPAP